jgi:YqaJ-like viral recombinase domain
MDAVLAFTQKGEPKAERKTYFRQKLAERLTGIAIQDNYVSREMLEGIEKEPLGIAAYEREEDAMVETVGFCLSDEVERLGYSPDGFVGKDGLVEGKCPKPGTHLQYVLDGCIPEMYIAQIRTGLCVTGRKWCDFFSFSPEVPKPLQLMVIRYERNQADMDLIAAAAAKFNGEIDAAIEKLRGIVGHFDLPAAAMEEPEREDEAAEAFLSDEDIAWAQRGYTE